MRGKPSSLLGRLEDALAHPLSIVGVGTSSA
jgi:hypothetical protein